MTDDEQRTETMPASQLPAPTFSITLHNPTVVVLDVTMPGANGPEEQKVLRYLDRANPHMQIDVALPLDLAQKVAERLSMRASRIKMPTATDLASLGRPK